VDARPSDALALSLRTKAPIFVDNLVLESAKSVDVSSEQVDRERLQRWLESLDPDDLGYKM
jgi:bifunctional DNase/RNase